MKHNRSFLFGAMAGGAVVFVLLGAMLLLSGFQDASSKFGVVDIAKVVEGSNFGKQSQQTFAQMKKTREDLLEFVDTYRVLTAEQAQKLRELTLKANITAAEKAEMERIKADIIASDKKAKELATKSPLTPEDRTLMDEYAKRSQNMDQTANRWLREFTNEMQGWADRQKLASLERARAAIQEAAKAAGYTMVFEVGVAPYGSNDLTDAALKVMNAKP